MTEKDRWTSGFVATQSLRAGGCSQLPKTKIRRHALRDVHGIHRCSSSLFSVADDDMTPSAPHRANKNRTFHYSCEPVIDACELSVHTAGACIYSLHVCADYAIPKNEEGSSCSFLQAGARIDGIDRFAVLVTCCVGHVRNSSSQRKIFG